MNRNDQQAVKVMQDKKQFCKLVDMDEFVDYLKEMNDEEKENHMYELYSDMCASMQTLHKENADMVTNIIDQIDKRNQMIMHLSNQITAIK